MAFPKPGLAPTNRGDPPAPGTAGQFSGLIIIVTPKCLKSLDKIGISHFFRKKLEFKVFLPSRLPSGDPIKI
jgi:hypothetical protein